MADEQFEAHVNRIDGPTPRHSRPLIPDSEFTPERLGGIVSGGLSWMGDEDNREVYIAIWLQCYTEDDFGTLLAKGHGIEVMIDGQKRDITRQTIIDGVQRQLEWEGATPEKLAQVDSPHDLHLLWGADDVRSSILQWGLGIHD